MSACADTPESRAALGEVVAVLARAFEEQETEAARTAGGIAVPGRLEEVVASWLPPELADLAPVIAGLAEEYAAALLGGRPPACGRWMAKARSTCARPQGHEPPHKSVRSVLANARATRRRQVKMQRLRAARAA